MTLKTPEGEYTFYKEDRERIKGRSMLPTETLRYIEALEAIARVAYEVWKLPYPAKTPSDKAKFDGLYDTLATVDFMDEESEAQHE